MRIGLKKRKNPRAGLTRPVARNGGRPEPDEAEMSDEPTPQPERTEPKVQDVRLRDLTFADWKAILIRAFKEFRDDNGPMLASALAYSLFFAIPSALLVLVGVFTLVAGPDTITSLMDRLHGIMPADATQLVNDSLRNLDSHPASSVAMTIVGFVLAFWATTGAMNAFMTAVNIAYDRKDRRSFVRKRIVASKMVVAIVFAFGLVAVLLIFGPQIEHWIGGGGALDWLWWILQWPILLTGLLAAFATLLYLGPDVDTPKWQFLTPGALVAALLWIASSGLFAVYTSMFGSYNKTWGSLAAVIVTLTWLWLTSMALLFGAEINSEVERSRQLRSKTA
jgi:membrane protein